MKAILKKQKVLYGIFVTLFIIGIFILVLFFDSGQRTKRVLPTIKKDAFEVVSEEISGDNVRLAHIESFHEVLSERLQTLEKRVLDLNEDNALLSQEKESLAKETILLKARLESFEEERNLEKDNTYLEAPQSNAYSKNEFEQSPKFREWSLSEHSEGKNVLYEIPAGTVVKAVLVSGADCSVAVQKPTGPNMVLLQPLSNGRLPKKLQVPLKGSVIIGNAIGDISSERVFIRAERMTLVQNDGDFVETEVSAYISGEDGREGMRGIVVDKSGSIITRAGFAAFLQGVGQGIQATLGNQTLEKLAKVSSQQSILNLDLARTSGFKGASTALNKMADYYIKRAEQLQPTIQIAAGRIVDIVFTKTVKIGERNLKRKLDIERNLNRSKAL